MPYTVVSGDTLGEIATQLGVPDWRTLYVNGKLASETDPTRLQIGSIIQTPAEFTGAVSGGGGGETGINTGPTPSGEAGTGTSNNTAPTDTDGDGVIERNEEFFPNEPLTQRLMEQVVQVITQAGLPIDITRENVGALIQTFFKGDAADMARGEFTNKGLGDILFHFTYQRSVLGARAVLGQSGVVNPNAVDEINAVTSGIQGGFSFGLGSGGTFSGANGGVIGSGGIDPQSQLHILSGNRVTWYYDDASGKWYVGYGLPNSRREMIFEADPDQMDALFGAGQRPTSFHRMRFQALLSQERTTFAGNIAEMQGEGSFEDEVAKVIALALDDGRLPEWAEGDGAALDIIFIAQAEGKSADWTLTQLAKLPSFQQRFPGIQQFRQDHNLTLGEAVTGFLQFEAGVKSALDSAGFNGAAMHQTMVAALMGKGYSLNVVADSISTFKRMKDFAPALEAFNQILSAEGMPTISTQADFFQFMRGEAPAEVYQLYEASSIQEAAVQAGLGDIFTAPDAIRAALATDQTLTSATKAMQQAATLLLRLRNEVDVGKFDLDQDELIDISLGMAPRSGRTEADISDSINRAVSTAQGFLQQRARPFIGFTSQGTPQAASLSNARQQS